MVYLTQQDSLARLLVLAEARVVAALQLEIASLKFVAVDQEDSGDKYKEQ